MLGDVGDEIVARLECRECVIFRPGMFASSVVWGFRAMEVASRGRRTVGFLLSLLRG